MSIKPIKLEHCGFDEGGLPPPWEPPEEPARQLPISCTVGRLQQ